MLFSVLPPIQADKLSLSLEGGAFVLQVSAKGSEAVQDDDRPLLLVVCNEPQRLAEVRENLRHAGVLPASGRSVEAAISLLSQVRVDGCVLFQSVTAEDARRIESCLDRFSPGCPRLVIQEFQQEEIPGWMACAEQNWLKCVLDAFGLQ